MRHRLSITAFLLCIVTAIGASAQIDIRIGQWRNKADPQNIMTYSADGKGLKTEVVNVDANGNKTVWSYTTMLDGTDAVITNGGNRHIASVLKVDPWVNEITYKSKDGRVTQLARNVVSADGQTLTVTFSTPEGKQTNVAVYEKMP